MTFLEISGIGVGIDSGLCKLARFTTFLSNRQGKPDISVRLHSVARIYKPQGTLLLDNNIKWILKTMDKNGFALYICAEKSEEIIALLDVDENWTDASFFYLENPVHTQAILNGRMDEALFCNCLLNHMGIVIHASAIKWEGKSFLFAAPSGTGKSTQAGLWNTYMGAVILNDDSPAVRLQGDQIIVYGTPWGGKASIFINDHAPLTAIFILEQSMENTIRQLSNREAAGRLLPRCYLPYYHPKRMDTAIGLADRIISTTPVFLLNCRPDRDSVELVYQCIK